MDVDGAGGLLMGFIESLTKQHKLDQQQQQQKQQQKTQSQVVQSKQGQQSPKQHQTPGTVQQPEQQAKQQKHQHPKPTPPSAHAFPRVRHKHAARMEMEARLAASGASSSGSTSCSGGVNSPSSAKKARHVGDTSMSERQKSGNADDTSSTNSNSGGGLGGGSGGDSGSGSGGGGGGCVVRDAVAPPRRPLSTSSPMVTDAILRPRLESRKRPREQQGSTGVPMRSQCEARPGRMDTEEVVSSIFEGSMSSEGGISEEGGYEEDGDGDGGSWGCSGKESGSTEESNETSVSEGDYRGEDERCSSFEERDNNDGSEEEVNVAERSKSSCPSRPEGVVVVVAGPASSSHCEQRALLS